MQINSSSEDKPKTFLSYKTLEVFPAIGVERLAILAI